MMRKILAGTIVIFLCMAIIPEGAWAKVSTGSKAWSNGCKYTGQLINGKAEGKGTITYPNGRKINGKWKNDKLNGPGTLIEKNGTRYSGLWKNNVVVGKLKKLPAATKTTNPSSGSLTYGSPAAEPTAEKTYTNKEAGYSLTYPSSWVYVEMNTQDGWNTHFYYPNSPNPKMTLDLFVDKDKLDVDPATLEFIKEGSTALLLSDQFGDIIGEKNTTFLNSNTKIYQVHSKADATIKTDCAVTVNMLSQRNSFIVMSVLPGQLDAYLPDYEALIKSIKVSG
ncbi:MAG: hypothetical protein ACM3QW_07740 [Ignavibacteriales bacterium]